MRSQRSSILILLLLAFGNLTVSSCKSLELGRRSTSLAAAAGGSVGALIGKKAGNSAIGATIGAALGGSTGAFIASRFNKPSGNGKKVQPLYVLNGTPFKEKAAQSKLQNIDLQNISNVKVLDNFQATALYGNKGENGAIVIDYK